MLRIHDIRGRLMQAVADGVFAAKEHRLAWDGCASYDPQLGAGIYFAEFGSAELHAISRIVTMGRARGRGAKPLRPGHREG